MSHRKSAISWYRLVPQCRTSPKPANNNANNAKNGLRVIILTEKQQPGITRKIFLKTRFRVIVKWLKLLKNNNAKNSTPYRGIKALRG